MMVLLNYGVELVFFYTECLQYDYRCWIWPYSLNDNMSTNQAFH